MNVRGLVILGVVVVGLLGGLYWLLRPTPESSSPSQMSSPSSRAPSSPPAPGVPAKVAPALAPAARPAADPLASPAPQTASPATTSAPSSSPRQYVRENADGTTTLVTDHTGDTTKDPNAKPAPFSPESFAAVQRAGQPAITECAKALPPGTKGTVGVVAQLSAQGGKITVSAPEVRPAGFADEAFAACVSAKMAGSTIDAPAQGDASYGVVLSYRIR